MNKNLKPVLIAIAVATTLGGGFLWAANQKAASKTSGASMPLAKAASEGFVPSAYPGVMVRRVPLSKAETGVQTIGKGQDGLVRVLPGGQLPPRVVRPGTRSVAVKRQGETAKGGTAAKLPEDRIPRVTAQIDKNGKVVVD